MAAKKKTNKEKENEFASQVAEKLVRMIEEGTGPWQAGADRISVPMPFNGHTGRSYNGNNVISLWIESVDKGYADPRWYTFKQLKKEGGYVRKGESATKIIFWKQRTVVEKLDKDGKVIDKSDTTTRVARVHEKRVPVARVYNVFNAAQCEGIEPFKIADLDRELEWSLSQRVENLIEKTGVVIEHKAMNVPHYIPSRDTIVMPELAQFHSQDRYYESLLHELAHWTGHESRLERPFRNQFGTEEYAREELRAELAMVMMTSQLGVGYSPKNAAAYSESWIKALKDNPREIMDAAKDAQKIFDYVMQHDPDYVAPSYDDEEEIVRDKQHEKSLEETKDSPEVSKADEMHPLDRFRVNQIAKKEEEIKQYIEWQNALDKEKLPAYKYEQDYKDYQRKIDETQKEIDGLKERLGEQSLEELREERARLESNRAEALREGQERFEAVERKAREAGLSVEVYLDLPENHDLSVEFQSDGPADELTDKIWDLDIQIATAERELADQRDEMAREKSGLTSADFARAAIAVAAVKAATVTPAPSLSPAPPAPEVLTLDLD